MSTWDNAIRHTRALESALDTKLSNYSRIGADIAGGSASTSSEAAEEGIGGYKLVEEEVEELLDKVRSLCAVMFEVHRYAAPYLGRSCAAVYCQRHC